MSCVSIDIRTMPNSIEAPTLFSFASRHHPLLQDPSTDSDSSSRYSTSFIEPTGLHPQMQLSISSSAPTYTSYPESCSLHAYLTLPSTLFPDKYQLSNPLLLQTLNLRSVRSISGYTDLEAPDYAVKPWGSSMLAELEPPSAGSGQQWNATVPLHLRYLSPRNETSGLSEALIPWPVVFWACAAEEGSKMATNPFDRVNIGYDGVFGTNTIFYHLTPKVVGSTGENNLIEKLEVPVLDAGWIGMRNGWVEGGTGLIVAFGWLWIVWKSWPGAIWGSKDAHRLQEKKQQ